MKQAYYVLRVLSFFFIAAFVWILCTKQDDINDPKTRDISLKVKRSYPSAQLIEFLAQPHPHEEMINRSYAEMIKNFSARKTRWFSPQTSRFLYSIYQCNSI